MGKKTNPRRKPATEADVKKAWGDGADFGLNFCIRCFIFTLRDKFNFQNDEIVRLNREFEKLVEAYRRGDIKQADLDSVLDEEFHVTVKMV